MPTRVAFFKVVDVPRHHRITGFQEVIQDEAEYEDYAQPIKIVQPGGFAPGATFTRIKFGKSRRSRRSFCDLREFALRLPGLGADKERKLHATQRSEARMLTRVAFFYVVDVPRHHRITGFQEVIQDDAEYEDYAQPIKIVQPGGFAPGATFTRIEFGKSRRLPSGRNPVCVHVGLSYQLP